MRVARGKNIIEVGFDQFRAMSTGYERTIIDVGTGDGKFVYRLARSNPSLFYIGIDSSAENLTELSGKALKKPSRGGVPNVLFVVASAEDLPHELDNTAAGVHVNFPWGRLLQGLVEGEERILASISRIAQPQAYVDMLINYSLFTEPIPQEVLELPELTSDYINNVLKPKYAKAGILIGSIEMIGKDSVKDMPTSWAKRLAYGREPRTIHITASIKK